MKNKVIEYVMNSPGNTNRAVLESLLEAIIGDGGSSDNVKTIIDVDLVLDEESGFMVYEDMAFNDIKLIEGEQYTVTLGEDVYTTKAWHGTEDGFEIFVLGNKQLFLEGAEDTGEPFAYIQECGDGGIGHGVIVANGATHITITLVESGSGAGGAKVAYFNFTPDKLDEYENVYMGIGYLVKVSDEVPTYDELLGGYWAGSLNIGPDGEDIATFSRLTEDASSGLVRQIDGGVEGIIIGGVLMVISPDVVEVFKTQMGITLTAGIWVNLAEAPISMYNKVQALLVWGV